jgi:hypothetical protein
MDKTKVKRLLSDTMKVNEDNVINYINTFDDNELPPEVKYYLPKYVAYINIDKTREYTIKELLEIYFKREVMTIVDENVCNGNQFEEKEEFECITQFDIDEWIYIH